jgi:hypothetical protein
MLKEPVTNINPIGNGLLKSITDQCPISNGLLKSVTYHCRIGNRLLSPLPKISYWRHMLVGCVSFDCHPGSPFFSHQRHMLSHLCLNLSTPLALSLQKATPIPTTTLALSLSLEGHSLDLCAQMSPLVCPVCRRQLRAL